MVCRTGSLTQGYQDGKLPTGLIRRILKMALSINQNIMAMNSYRNLSLTQSNLGKSLEKLSSGFRINRAADDSSGLAISEGLRSQVRGNKQAVKNAQDGISVVQTAEGALNEVHDMLQRMRELAVKGANDTNDSKARAFIEQEMGQLKMELVRVGASTNFDGRKLLWNGAKVDKDTVVTGSDFAIAETAGKDQAEWWGKSKGVLAFQVGANGDAQVDDISVQLEDLVTTTLKSLDTKYSVKGTEADIAIKDHKGYMAEIGKIDTAIHAVSKLRSDFGSVQNRFEHTINNLNVAVENLSASEARIRDTDMASEMMQFTRGQILQQAGTSMLAQANQVPQTVLSLLR
ncbi:bacterial flagellin domain protein [Mobiluncus curtisii subsp. curtisii ATCC 35241]|nr:bacterial flagellin domain protein [Mobiluncus curtisii subsp. curtisii ATCC 35241]EFU81547.1 bacterial flagellin domain protein [Mobiluncus holmesii ATCC 35242]MCU9986486.1 flagellin [Mobiluncus curtisii]MCV0000201.1 flagellin [Mobiluncus curtisii]MCV0021350.1 flagellin [Mobiluncus curtisii]